MDELTKLAIKYGTDKWGKHHYTPVYYELFKNRRNEVRKVLEIGPAEGAGLFMFRDFFPNATIYGAEIDQKRVDKLQGLDRIEVYKCDQSKNEDLINLISQTGSDIDLIIDDGSHNPLHQVYTQRVLTKLVFPTVKYIIEDVDDESANIIFDLLLQSKTRMLKVGKRHDDRLIIL